MYFPGGISQQWSVNKEPQHHWQSPLIQDDSAFHCGNNLTASSTADEFDKSLYGKKNRKLGLKKHMCNYCGKRCMTPAELTRHERIHTGEKPFLCNLCQKAFSLKQSLRVHMARHALKDELQD